MPERVLVCLLAGTRALVYGSALALLGAALAGTLAFQGAGVNSGAELREQLSLKGTRAASSLTHWAGVPPPQVRLDACCCIDVGRGAIACIGLASIGGRKVACSDTSV